MQTSKMRTARILLVFAVISGLVWRAYVSLEYQSRAWIDEMWVVLSPAYKLLTGYGVLMGDWSFEIRSWIPPGVLFLYLKGLNLLGLRDGPVVLPLVRLTISFLTVASALGFVFTLASRMRLRYPPVIAVGVFLFVPEFVHYGTLADLSVLAMPLLLSGLALTFFRVESGSSGWLERAGFTFLTLSAMIRFQYGVFPALLLVWYLYRGQRRAAVELAVTGVAGLVLDFALNSWMYGHPTLPILNYFRENTVGGMAAGYGVTPFYFSFELLWRFVTEPVFALIVATAVLSVRRVPFVAVAAFVFFLLHAFIGHKEYRFFYGPAVLLTLVSGLAFQYWLESKPTRVRLAWLGVFALVFAGFSSWRATTKVGWADYEVPAKLETKAGAQSDVRGLLVWGWSGIYSGSNYTFHRALPYSQATELQELIDRKLDPRDYNYVITREDIAAPCAEVVASEGGGRIYRCTTSEIGRLLELREASSLR